MTKPAELPKLGETIHFCGGTGRDDDVLIHEGIVNGEPRTYWRQRVVYIPVYVRRSDQNVLVNAMNIVDPSDG